MVATATNREEIFRAVASSQVDLIFSAAASSLGRKFQNHEQISFIFELFVSQSPPRSSSVDYARPPVPHMKQGLKQMRKAGSKKSRAQQVKLDYN